MKVSKYNGMVVLDRPLPMEDGTTIYGVLIDTMEEDLNTQQDNPISSYISYLLSCSQLFRGGGKISEDMKTWSIPQHHITITVNRGLGIFLGILMKDMLGYRIIETDDLIGYEDDEVVNKNLISSQGLIDRYDKENNNKQIDNNEESK